MTQTKGTTMTGSDATIVDIELADGSACELMRPAHWNGYLVSQPDLWRDDIDEAFQAWLAAQGFASVRHTRDIRGWDIGRGLRNHHEATDAFVARFGVPERGNIVMGASMGGLITRLLVETAPDLFVGAVPIDGGGAGMLATFNRGFDMAFIVSHLLMPESPIELVEAESVDAELARLNSAIEAARETPEGRARLALAASVGSVPVWSDPGREEPGSDDLEGEAGHLIAGMMSTLSPAYFFRSIVESLVGGVIVDNVAMDYAQGLARCGASTRVQALYDEAGLSLSRDLRLLAEAPRIAASRQAVDAAIDGFAVEAKVHCPVFVLKSLGDPDASVAEEQAYLAAAERAGTRDLIRVGFIHSAGHVNSTLAERAAALSVVVDRIESGSWQGLTSPRALNARAHGLAGDDRWDFTLRRMPGGNREVARFVAYEPWPYVRA
jgi:pimeloyl-ACP methyl ester carboxylesterase